MTRAHDTGSTFLPDNSDRWHLRYYAFDAAKGRSREYRPSTKIRETDPDIRAKLAADPRTLTPARRKAEAMLRAVLAEKHDTGLVATPTEALLAAGKDSLLMQYLAHARKVKHSTLHGYERVIRPMGQQTLGLRKAKLVTASDIAAYLTGMLDEGYSRATVALHANVLRAGLRWAHDMGMLRAVPHIEVPGGLERREDACPDEDFWRIVNLMDRDTADVALIVHLAARRPGNVVAIRREHLHLDDPIPWMKVPENKGGRQKMGIGNELMDLLTRRLRDRADETWLFPSVRTGHLTYGTVSRAWKRAASSLGLPWTLYSVKRQTISLLSMAMDRKAAMLVTGHRTESVFAGYDTAELTRRSADAQDALSASRRALPPANRAQIAHSAEPGMRRYADLQGLGGLVTLCWS
jgi:hypothetical protein